MGVQWWQQPTQELTTTPAHERRSARFAVRHQWWIGVAVLVLLLVAGLLVGAWTGALDHVPLLNHSAAVLAEVIGAGLLVVAWWRRDRRWLARTLPILLLAVAALVGAIEFTLRVTGTITDPYPPSFALWVGTGFAALAACPVVLRHRGSGSMTAWRKASAVVAVPLTLIGAFMLIDQEYGIWPQIGDVLDHSGALQGPQALHQLSQTGNNPPGQGVIVKLDAPSTVSHFPHRPGVVFLPPAYFTAERPNLPVLVMLVGSPGSPINWLKAGHGQAIDDAYAASHGGVAPVLVVADHNGSATNDSECVDGPKGNAETYLTVDVPAFITDTLHIRHDPSRWGIVGFSEGGTCSLDLVLRHPNVYRHIIDFGGDAFPNLGGVPTTVKWLYGGSVAEFQAHDPFRLMKAQQYPGVTAWFASGVQDTRTVAIGQRLAAAATAAGIRAHEFIGISGHNWQFASDALARIFTPLCVELGCLSGPTNNAPAIPDPSMLSAPLPTRSGRSGSPTNSAQHVVSRPTIYRVPAH